MKCRTRLRARTRLQRHTPLRSGGSKLKQGKPIRQQSAKQRARRQTWPDLRDAVLARAGGCCDFCAYAIDPDDWECHHRRLKSQGGLDEMANLVALHDACHARLHVDRPMAHETGFIVHHPDDPAHTPVLRHGTTWALPGETWTPVDPEETAA